MVRNPFPRNFRKAADAVENAEDAFGKLIADGTTSEIDIASQYIFNPERLRLFLNDTRQFPHYGSVAEFKDNDDAYILQPGDGDKMRVQSAESVSYTVQYVAQTSYAFQVNQSLQTGDKIRIGPWNGTDGWYIEHSGSQSDREVDVVRERGGTRKVLEEDVSLSVPVTEWNRIEIKYNWYNVGEIEIIQTYVDSNGEQKNDLITKIGEKDRGPKTGNLPLRQEIDQATGNTGLELVVGSMSSVTLGQVTNLTRAKGQDLNLDTSGSNNTWEPFYALKLDNEFSNVNAQLTDLEILQYDNNADVEVLVVSVDSSKTDASGFSVPEFQHDYNSAIRSTTSVSDVPRASDGTQVNLGSAEKPGGHTVATASLLSGGGQSESAASTTRSREVKKSVLRGDVLVFCARSSSIGGEINLNWQITQNW